MKYELKYVKPGSILFSGLPVVFLFLGLLGGLVAFYVTPSPIFEPLTAGARLVATGVFALVYALLMLALVLVSAFVYNLFCKGFGMRGVTVEFQPVDDGEEETEEDAQ